MSFVSLNFKPVVLSVGSAREAGPRGGPDTICNSVHVNGLTRERLKAAPPTAVVAWLFCADYDIFDVATALTAAGYQGHLIAVSEPLPNKAVVCREVKTLFPNLRFDLNFSNKLGEAAQTYFSTVSLQSA